MTATRIGKIRDLEDSRKINNMRASLIIAAGGTGSRFEKSLKVKSGNRTFDLLKTPASKLFYPLAGRPLLERTLSSFQKFPEIQETILAVPPGTEKIIREISQAQGWKEIKMVQGGKSRAESVWKALQKTDRKNSHVLVHDGARPFVNAEVMKDLFQAMKDSEAAILAKKVIPTIKEADEKSWVRRTVDRKALFEAETPQMMRRELLERAYKKIPQAFEATDEASLMEALSIPVKLVAHDSWNPKITTVKDFELAEAYLNRQATVRTGWGRDTHRLVKGRKFWLGGMQIPFEKGPLGHSDGDALLHAITDAILGAAGAGDIGDWFSDKNPKYKNIASSKMLQAVMRDVNAQGYKVQHVDTVVILEKPKLGTYKSKIKNHISQLLALPEEAVSVKAKTAEGLGPEGQGLAITCEAMVTVRKYSL